MRIERRNSRRTSMPSTIRAPTCASSRHCWSRHAKAGQSVCQRETCELLPLSLSQNQVTDGFRIGNPLDFFIRIDTGCARDGQVADADQPREQTLVNLDRTDVTDDQLPVAFGKKAALQCDSSRVDPQHYRPPTAPGDNQWDDEPAKYQVPEEVPPRRSHFGEQFVGYHLRLCHLRRHRETAGRTRSRRSRNLFSTFGTINQCHSVFTAILGAP